MSKIQIHVQKTRRLPHVETLCHFRVTQTACKQSSSPLFRNKKLANKSVTFKND
jgi:hypothetical protein